MTAVLLFGILTLKLCQFLKEKVSSKLTENLHYDLSINLILCHVLFFCVMSVHLCKTTVTDFFYFSILN